MKEEELKRILAKRQRKKRNKPQNFCVGDLLELPIGDLVLVTKVVWARNGNKGYIEIFDLKLMKHETRDLMYASKSFKIIR